MLLNLYSFPCFQHYVLDISGTPEMCNYSIILQIFLLGEAGIAYFDPLGKLVTCIFITLSLLRMVCSWPDDHFLSRDEENEEGPYATSSYHQ